MNKLHDIKCIKIDRLHKFTTRKNSLHTFYGNGEMDYKDIDSGHSLTKQVMCSDVFYLNKTYKDTG